MTTTSPPRPLPAPALPTGGPPRPAPARHRSGPLAQLRRRERSATAKAMVHQAFDLGITHFDLANNYGPPPGSAELTFGTLLKRSLAPYRDELIIASKAGYVMWDGPYGDGGSAKYLFASLHQSLRRLGLDYVDIFYHHRPDPRTPLEETCQALALMVRQGKALYIGLSNYPAPLAAKAAARLAELGTPAWSTSSNTPCSNAMLSPTPCRPAGSTAWGGRLSPLAGLLSDRYLAGIPRFPRRQCQPLPHGGPDHRGEARHRPRPACTGLQRVSPCRNSHCNGCCATPW